MHLQQVKNRKNMRFISIGLAFSVGMGRGTLSARLPTDSRVKEREICTQDLALKLKSPELLSVFLGRQREKSEWRKNTFERLRKQPLNRESGKKNHLCRSFHRQRDVVLCHCLTVSMSFKVLTRKGSRSLVF